MSEDVTERIRKLRAEIEKGLAEAKAGQLLDGPTVFAKLRARSRAMGRQAERARPKRRRS